MGRLADAVKPAVPRRVRASIVRSRLRTRQRLPGGRALPGVLVIGAQRCGTSSLYKYLGRHPAVLAPLRKETEYLSRFHVQGIEWYRAQFPTQAHLDWVSWRRRCQALTFEATPDYLWHPLAAERAAQLLPGARIVVLLRDPVERALSHHQHMTRLGFETLPFEAALDAEEGRLAGERERILADGAYPGRSYLRFSYASRGRYLEQLLAWTDRYPSERLLVLRSEDLYADPAATWVQLVEFLGLPPWDLRRFRNHSRSPGPSPPMAAGTRRRLEAYFAPHNERLSAHLGRDFAWAGPG